MRIFIYVLIFTFFVNASESGKAFWDAYNVNRTYDINEHEAISDLPPINKNYNNQIQKEENDLDFIYSDFFQSLNENEEIIFNKIYAFLSNQLLQIKDSCITDKSSDSDIFFCYYKKRESFRYENQNFKKIMIYLNINENDWNFSKKAMSIIMIEITFDLIMQDLDF